MSEFFPPYKTNSFPGADWFSRLMRQEEFPPEIVEMLSPELLARFVMGSANSAEKEVVEAALELEPSFARELEELRQTLSHVRQRDRETAVLHSLFWGTSDAENWEIEPELVRAYAAEQVTTVQREVVEAALELDPLLANEIRELQNAHRIFAETKTVKGVAGARTSPLQRLNQSFSLKTLLWTTGATAITAAGMFLFFVPKTPRVEVPLLSADLLRLKEENRKLKDEIERQKSFPVAVVPQPEPHTKPDKPDIKLLPSDQNSPLIRPKKTPGSTTKDLLALKGTGGNDLFDLSSAPASKPDETMLGGDEPVIILTTQDGERFRSVKPTLTWKPVEGEKEYEVTLEGDDHAQSRLVQGTSFTPTENLKRDRIYRWQVTVKGDDKSYSPSQTFQIISAHDAKVLEKMDRSHVQQIDQLLEKHLYGEARRLIQALPKDSPQRERLLRQRKQKSN